MFRQLRTGARAQIDHMDVVGMRLCVCVEGSGAAGAVIKLMDYYLLFRSLLGLIDWNDDF